MENINSILDTALQEEKAELVVLFTELRNFISEQTGLAGKACRNELATAGPTRDMDYFLAISG